MILPEIDPNGCGATNGLHPRCVMCFFTAGFIGFQVNPIFNIIFKKLSSSSSSSSSRKLSTSSKSLNSLISFQPVSEFFHATKKKPKKNTKKPTKLAGLHLRAPSWVSVWRLIGWSDHLKGVPEPSFGTMSSRRPADHTTGGSWVYQGESFPTRVFFGQLETRLGGVFLIFVYGGFLCPKKKKRGWTYDVMRCGGGCELVNCMLLDFFGCLAIEVLLICVCFRIRHCLGDSSQDEVSGDRIVTPIYKP